jgi:hypothetical protein
MGAEKRCEHLLCGGLEDVGAPQDQGALMREVDATARTVSGGELPAEVVPEDELGCVAGRQLAAVDGDQRATRTG